MGIRLDWEIEAENEHIESSGEDPETRKLRWKARLRLFGLMILFVVLVGVLIGGLILRLRQVDWEIEQSLRDTIDSEVATLRLGDRQAFLGFQRSATDEWMVRQDGMFDAYQALKLESDVELTGRVINALVDRQRGRVQVEEIVDGVPFLQTWFFWRYEDGWRHVPPDYTFWGDSAILQNDVVTVYYHDLDAPFAQVVFDQVSTWLTTGCAALLCESIPHITVDITPNPLARLDWVDVWHLQIPSPYIGRALLDSPFEPSMRFQSGVLVARRLVDNASTLPMTGESAFLRDGIVSWLVERFAQVQMESHLVYSLAARYGDPAVGRLLDLLTPNSTAAVLSEITGTSLEQAGLDWRDYVAWRLSQASGGQEFDVIAAVVEYDTDGNAQIRAQVSTGAAQTEVLYRLIGGMWQPIG